MDFFNSLINDVFATCAPFSEKEYKQGEKWKDLGKNQIVLQRDTAYELEGIGFNLITSDKIDEGITVIGPDLSEISGNCNFARISIIEIDDVDGEQKAYNLIKKLEYVKYHHFPEGYMIRTASRSHKENVRVSKSSIKNGIDFGKIGSLLIEKYKENSAVNSVRIIFITEKDFPVERLNAIAKRNSEITETLNHIMNSVNFDCETCKLKPVCDEVEGMKELHFKNSAMG